MQRALEGIKVVEIGHYIAGPYCAQLLADMGADVIKVERPGGEAARDFGPYINEESTYFTSYNRNKRSITINFKSEEGRAVFRRLLEKADVVIENQRPGFLAKMGFSYEDISAFNPGIIMTAISGYGQTGPYAKRPALDMIMQGVGGLMAMTGFPESPPTKAGVAIADFLSAMYAAMGTVIALYSRKETGKGQIVDVAMLDSLFTILENWPAMNKMAGFIPPRVGNSRVVTGPSNAYPTSDGYVYIAAVANQHFAILAKEIGHPELADDPELATSALRKKAQTKLDTLIEAWTKNKTTKDVFNRLSDLGITAGPVNSIPDLVKDEQIHRREMLIEMRHPKIENLTMIGNPMKLSTTPPQYITPPPTVGQHTVEILQELGFTEDGLEKMLQTAVQ